MSVTDDELELLDELEEAVFNNELILVETRRVGLWPRKVVMVASVRDNPDGGLDILPIAELLGRRLKFYRYVNPKEGR